MPLLDFEGVGMDFGWALVVGEECMGLRRQVGSVIDKVGSVLGMLG